MLDLVCETIREMKRRNLLDPSLSRNNKVNPLPIDCALSVECSNHSLEVHGVFSGYALRIRLMTVQTIKYLKMQHKSMFRWHNRNW